MRHDFKTTVVLRRISKKKGGHYEQPEHESEPASGGQDDAQTSRYFDNPYGYPYGYPYGPGQPNPNDSNGEWKPVSPFKLMESWLPQRAKNAIRGAYGIIGVIAIVLRLGAVYLAGCDA